MSETSQDVLSSGPAGYLSAGAREVTGQLWLMKEWLVFQPSPIEAARGVQNISVALSTVDYVGRGEVDLSSVLHTGLKTPLRVVAGGQDYQFAVDNVDYWVAQVAAQVRAVKGEPQPPAYQPGVPPASAVPPPPSPPVAPQPPTPAPEIPVGPPPQPYSPMTAVPPPPPAPPVPAPPVPEGAPQQAEAPTFASAEPQPGTPASVSPESAQEEAVSEQAEVSSAVGSETPSVSARPATTKEGGEKRRQFVIAPPPSEPLIPQPPPIPDDLKAAVAPEVVPSMAEAPGEIAVQAEEAPAEAGLAGPPSGEVSQVVPVSEATGAAAVSEPAAAQSPPEAAVVPETEPAEQPALGEEPPEGAPLAPEEVSEQPASVAEAAPPAAEAAEEGVEERGAAEEPSPEVPAVGEVQEAAPVKGEVPPVEEAAKEVISAESGVVAPEHEPGKAPPEEPGVEVGEVEEVVEAAPRAKLEIVGVGHLYYEVSDVASALTFYEDVLGLEIEGQKSAQEAWVRAGESRFALRSSGGISQRGAVLALEVEDIQKAREALRQKGAFPEEILDSPSGERYFYIHDKDRNRIAIWERPKG